MRGRTQNGISCLIVHDESLGVKIQIRWIWHTLGDSARLLAPRTRQWKTQLFRAHVSRGDTMHNTDAHRLIHTYVQGWITADREHSLSTLDPDCVIIESYGPTYRGKDMIARWIDSWFAPGNIVNRWEVTSLYTVDESCFLEWIFECTYEGSRSSFEGASLAQARDSGKETRLCCSRFGEGGYEGDNTS